MPHLWKFKQPYNVNVAASVAGLASLRRADYIRDTVERIKRERIRLFDALREISFLRPYPSQANFILCDVVGRSGAEVKQALERHGRARALLQQAAPGKLHPHFGRSPGADGSTAGRAA